MIEDQFIQVQNTTEFQELLKLGEISPDSIAFCEDTDYIYAKGHYYTCVNNDDLNTIDLSYVDIYGEKQSTQNTANCYVVCAPGYYRLPLVYGNGIKNGKINSAAYTNIDSTNRDLMDFVNVNGVQITSPYIYEDLNLDCSDLTAQFTIGDADIFTNLRITNGYLYFRVTSIPVGGANGILSVVMPNGTIAWSWHIWVFADDLSTVTVTTNTGVEYEMLPVFLATTYDNGDPLKRKNWFYQWGRATPTLGPAAYKSTTFATSYGQLKRGTDSNWDCDKEYRECISNPNNFFTESRIHTWFGGNDYYNLWDASCTSQGASDNNSVKTVYDPSPVGFKVPTATVYTGLVERTIKKQSTGLYFSPNESSEPNIFFPYSGNLYRSNGQLSQVGSNGYVFSSSPANNRSYNLEYSKDRVILNNDSPKTMGASVCCIVDK